MPILLANAKTTMNGVLASGLQAANPILQNLFDTGSNDIALINALTALRSQYTLDQMRVNRSAITAIDGDPNTQTILGQLSAACTSLTNIQNASQADTAWVASITTHLDNAIAVYTSLTKL
jgi:hypothetical protein